MRRSRQSFLTYTPGELMLTFLFVLSEGKLMFVVMVSVKVCELCSASWE